MIQWRLRRGRPASGVLRKGLAALRLAKSSFERLLACKGKVWQRTGRPAFPLNFHYLYGTAKPRHSKWLGKGEIKKGVGGWVTKYRSLSETRDPMNDSEQERQWELPRINPYLGETVSQWARRNGAETVKVRLITISTVSLLDETSRSRKG